MFLLDPSTTVKFSGLETSLSSAGMEAIDHFCVVARDGQSSMSVPHVCFIVLLIKPSSSTSFCLLCRRISRCFSYSQYAFLEQVSPTTRSSRGRVWTVP